MTIKLQICSMVLAGASGNMFGCFAGLAEALDIAEPEPEAPLCVRHTPVPCGAAHRAQRGPVGKARAM